MTPDPSTADLVHTATVMIVDDHPENLELLGTVLRDQGYRTAVFPSGALALGAAARRVPDLVLLDISMPEMDGYEVCRRFKESEILRDVPILFLSALSQAEDRIRGLEAGGVDFIGKPFNIAEVLARVATHLELRMARSMLKIQTRNLKVVLDSLSTDQMDSQIAVLLATARLVDLRDTTSVLNTERIRAYSHILATLAAAHPSFSAEIDADFLEDIEHASTLHDIGKLGIVDSILLKPGRLTDQEFEIMKSHTTIGESNVAAVRLHHPTNTMLAMGKNIARSHHERWDGQGYPDQLSGDSIPLAARIVSLADTYDAMCSDRCYKVGKRHEQAVSEIESESGLAFDPQLVSIFLDNHEEFQAIRESL